jgi:hypothetical protein
MEGESTEFELYNAEDSARNVEGGRYEAAQNTAQHTENVTHEFIDMALDILRRNLAISLEQVASFWTQPVT